MDTSCKTIPLHLHPLGFIEAFTHFGADLHDLLEHTDINHNMINSKDIKISYAQQSTLIKNGIRLCDKPGIGLLVGEYFDWSYNGSVGYIVHSSPSLQEAVAAFLRFLLIAQPYYSVYANRPCFYMDAGDMIVDPILHFGPSSHDPGLFAFELEFRLAMALRIADLCGNKSVDNTDVHVRLSYPEPKYVDLYQKLPCASFEFGCKQSSISAHIDYVTRPWRDFRKPAFQRIISQCEEEFLESSIEASNTSKVRWLISSLYFCQRVTLETIAGLLRLTPRALTRRLSSEGTTFRNIMHEVQMDITLHHLKFSQLSVEKIASLMGFSGASSLRRAVKNWSGNVVSEIRSEMLMRGVSSISRHDRGKIQSVHY